MSWTSRERVIASIEHREGDCVTIDITTLYDFYIDPKKYLSIGIKEEVKANTVTMWQAAQRFGQYPIKPFEHIRRSIDIIP